VIKEPIMNKRPEQQRGESAREQSARNRARSAHLRDSHQQHPGARMHSERRHERIDAYDPGGEYAGDAPAYRRGWPDVNYENDNSGRYADDIVGGDYLHDTRQPDIYDRRRERSMREDRQHAPQRSGYNETAGPNDNRSSLYGHPGRGDYMSRHSFGGAAGTQSGYEFPHGHRGKGPRNYVRSDERIREDLCERLLEDEHIDPSDIEVAVENGVVTLNGTVEERWVKHSVEDMAEACSGVNDIVNHLRVVPGGRAPREASGAS